MSVILRRGEELVQVCTLVPKHLRDEAKGRGIVLSEVMRNALEIVLEPEEMEVQECSEG